MNSVFFHSTVSPLKTLVYQSKARRNKSLSNDKDDENAANLHIWREKRNNFVRTYCTCLCHFLVRFFVVFVKTTTWSDKQILDFVNDKSTRRQFFICRAWYQLRSYYQLNSWVVRAYFICGTSWNNRKWSHKRELILFVVVVVVA